MEPNERDALLNVNETVASSSRSYSALDHTDLKRGNPLRADREKPDGVDRIEGVERSSSLAEELEDEEAISLYDKKCLLINREIDRMGMGRYQWSIWALCGLANFPLPFQLDLPLVRLFGAS
jgi:hypothetical protein